MVIAPWYDWAENKQKESGGSVEEWVAKYHQMSDRLTQILEEKGLMKDVLTPQRTDVTKVRHPKTLKEAGFIKDFPQNARRYGLETVTGFYERVSEPRIAELAASVMGITTNELSELRAKIELKLGQEYIDISKELEKYS